MSPAYYGTERVRKRGAGKKRGKGDGTIRVRRRENGSTKKRWRSLGSPFNVICNTGWPNDATGRDRTGIRVEACESAHVGDSPWVSERVYTKEGMWSGHTEERWSYHVHVSWSFGC